MCQSTLIQSIIGWKGIYDTLFHFSKLLPDSVFVCLCVCLCVQGLSPQLFNCITVSNTGPQILTVTSKQTPLSLPEQLECKTLHTLIHSHRSQWLACLARFYIAVLMLWCPCGKLDALFSTQMQYPPINGDPSLIK